MTRVVEIFLALDCVVLACLFYNMWLQANEPQTVEDLPDAKLAQEGGSCRPTQLIVNQRHSVDSPLDVSGRVGGVLLGFVDLLGVSEEQPVPLVAVVEEALHGHQVREPRSLVGGAV